MACEEHKEEIGKIFVESNGPLTQRFVCLVAFEMQSVLHLYKSLCQEVLPRSVKTQ
jgi:hypothetical protein